MYIEYLGTLTQIQKDRKKEPFFYFAKMFKWLIFLCGYV